MQISRALISLILIGVVQSVSAHVDYIGLNSSASPNSGSVVEVFSNFGWYDGTRSVLGDSHKLANGVFFNFHLDRAAHVNLTFSEFSGAGVLNPAFSVYAGLLPFEAHDDTATDPLNPKVIFPVFKRLPSPVDDGFTQDAFGRVSPLRDTVNVSQDYVGQFNALGSWSMANEAGEWSVIDYVAHAVAAPGATSASLSSLFLPAGDYTVAAAGNTPGGFIAGILGTLTYSANIAAVPAPAGLWLLGSGLSALFAFRRKTLSDR